MSITLGSDIRDQARNLLAHSIALALRRPRNVEVYERALRDISARGMAREVAGRVCFQLLTERAVPAEVVRFEVTNRCNLRCRMCPQPNQMTRPKLTMEYDRYLRVLDANPWIGRVELWNWGEPLLHPRLVDMVEAARSRGMRSSVTTNATLMTQGKAEALLKAGLSEIVFSIDGIGERYREIRGVPYDRAERGIKCFVRAAKDARSSVRMMANVVDVPDTTSHQGTVEELTSYGIQPQVTSCSIYDGSMRRTQPCREWYRSLVVLADGRVVPCCVDYEGELEVGNAWEQTDLTRIFNNEPMRAYRRAMRNVQTMPRACRSCFEYTGASSVAKFV